MNYQKQIIELQPLHPSLLSNFENINQLMDYHFQVYLKKYKPKHKIYQIFDQNQSSKSTIIYRRVYYTSPDENHPLVCQYYDTNKTHSQGYKIYVIDTLIFDRSDFRLVGFQKYLKGLESHYLLGLLASINASIHIRRFKTFEDPRYRLDNCHKIKNCHYRLRLIHPLLLNNFKVSYQAKAQQHLKDYWVLAEHNPEKARQKFKELEGFFRYKNDTNHLKVITTFFEVKRMLEKLI